MNIYGRKCPLESCQDLVRALLEELLAAEFCLFQEGERAAGRSVWRNGFARKVVRGRFGEFSIRVPRDRAGLFSPFVLKKGFVLLGELDELCVRVFSAYNGRRGGRLYVIRELVGRVYGSPVSGGDLRFLTEAIIRGCRGHRRLLSAVHSGVVAPGVRFRYDGVIGLWPGVSTASTESKFVAEMPAEDNVSPREQVALSPGVSASSSVEIVSGIGELDSVESIALPVPASRVSFMSSPCLAFPSRFTGPVFYAPRPFPASRSLLLPLSFSFFLPFCSCPTLIVIHGVVDFFSRSTVLFLAF